MCVCILRQMAELEKRCCIRGYHALLLIDMDSDCIGEQFPCILYSIILQRKIINPYNKNFREKTFCGLALSTKYFNSELFPNYSN